MAVTGREERSGYRSSRGRWWQDDIRGAGFMEGRCRRGDAGRRSSGGCFFLVKDVSGGEVTRAGSAHFNGIGDATRGWRDDECRVVVGMAGDGAQHGLVEALK